MWNRDNLRGAKVNIAIIIINILYFLFLEIQGSTLDTGLMLKYGAMYAPYIMQGEEWRLFTSIFMHFGVSHLANNMLILYLLGDNVERAFGHIKYLIIYILTGVGANIVSMYFSIYISKRDYFSVGAGASGAIFGIIGALLFAVIANKGRLEDVSSRQLFILLGLSLYFGFTSSGVDNVAHVFGAVIGFVLSVILYRKKRADVRL